MDDRIQPTGVNKLLSALYSSVSRIRNAVYDRALCTTFESAAPVICVGNIVAGGSGKSPMTQFLAHELLRVGKRPVILSRGYGGTLRGPHQLTVDDSPMTVGDEPFMHFRKLHGECPVVIARDRAAGAQFVDEHALGDVIILDDGFQHRRLSRTLDLLLFDVTSQSLTELLSEHLLPAGVLREQPVDALKRAGAVVLVRRHPAPPLTELPVLSFRPELPIFQTMIRPVRLRDLYTLDEVPLVAVSNCIGSVLTAIAQPGSFVRSLEALGVQIEATKAFPDHHLFTQEEYLALGASSENPVFVTEKDAVKLREFVSTPGECFALEIECVMQSDDRERLLTQIRMALAGQLARSGKPSGEFSSPIG